MLDSYANVAAALVAVGGGLAASSRVLARWVRQAYRRQTQRRALLETQLPALITQMARVHAELTPNGGGSLKDAIVRIERRQLVAEKRTWALLADAPTAIFEADANGRVVTVNRTYTRWTGRERSELAGLGWLATVSDTDRDRVAAAWRSAVAEERELRETYTLADDAAPITFEARVVRDDQGRSLGFVGTLTRQKDHP